MHIWVQWNNVYLSKLATKECFKSNMHVFFPFCWIQCFYLWVAESKKVNTSTVWVIYCVWKWHENGGCVQTGRGLSLFVLPSLLSGSLHHSGLCEAERCRCSSPADWKSRCWIQQTGCPGRQGGRGLPLHLLTSPLLHQMHDGLLLPKESVSAHE